MKTIIKIFFVFIFCTVAVSSLNAQAHYRRNIYGDFFGGMTLASMDMGGKNEYKKLKMGFMVGGNVNFKLFHNIEFQTGLHLMKKGSLQHDKRTWQQVSGIVQTRDVKNTIDANYMQVPFNLGFEVPIARDLFLNMHAGVYAAYGFKGDIKQKGFVMNHDDMIRVQQNHTDNKVFGPGNLKKWDYGVGANIGIVYDIFVLRLQYDHGIANVATDVLAGDGNEWKTRNYSFCLGFRF